MIRYICSICSDMSDTNKLRLLPAAVSAVAAKYAHTNREKTIRLTLFGLLTHTSHNIYLSVSVAAVDVIAVVVVYLVFTQRARRNTRRPTAFPLFYTNAIFVNMNSYWHLCLILNMLGVPTMHNAHLPISVCIKINTIYIVAIWIWFARIRYIHFPITKRLAISFLCANCVNAQTRSKRSFVVNFVSCVLRFCNFTRVIKNNENKKKRRKTKLYKLTTQKKIYEFIQKVEKIAEYVRKEPPDGAKILHADKSAQFI